MTGNAVYYVTIVHLITHIVPTCAAAEFQPDEAIALMKEEISEVRRALDGFSGAIVMWEGNIAFIPSGWALCNGQNGTPNLLDKFIVGSGEDYNAGDVGGSDSLSLRTEQLPAHSHTMETAGDHYHGIQFSYYKELKRNTGSITNFTPRDFDGINGSCGPDGKFQCMSYNTSSSGTHVHTLSNTGSGIAIDNRPQYYALAFLMKL